MIPNKVSAREQKRTQALDFLLQGNTAMATKKFKEAVDITPQMAIKLYRVPN